MNMVLRHFLPPLLRRKVTVVSTTTLSADGEMPCDKINAWAPDCPTMKEIARCTTSSRREPRLGHPFKFSPFF